MYPFCSDLQAKKLNILNQWINDDVPEKFALWRVGHDFLHLAGELLQRERLGEEVDVARDLHALAQTVLGVARYEDHLHVGPLVADVADQFRVIGLNLKVAILPFARKPLFPDDVKPGPIGEYLEVIDIDPASGSVYSPVDLNHPYLMARDGSPPSEGNPQFHQQMVYAVCSLVYAAFRRALGRDLVW